MEYRKIRVNNGELQYTVFNIWLFQKQIKISLNIWVTYLDSQTHTEKILIPLHCMGSAMWIELDQSFIYTLSGTHRSPTHTHY